MAGPMDFSLGNIPDPTAAFASGAQLGAGLRTLGIQQQQQDLQLQAQQQALQAQQQQAAVINALINKPNANAQDYAAAVAILPKERAELIQKSWEMRNAEQQQNVLQDTGKVFAALGAGQPAVASQLLRDRSTLLKTSDPQQSRALETMAGVVDAHPEFAKALIGMHLASLPGGDKVITNLSGLGTEQRAAAKAPAELRKAEADADKAGYDATTARVAAGNAPTATTLDNQRKAEEIKSAQLKRDIDRLEVQIKSADSETKRGELTLQRDKLVQEQEQLKQKQGIAAQDSQNTLTSALDTLNTITTHRGMDGFFTAPGTKWGAIWRVVPGSDRQALESHIDTLKSQLTLGKLMEMKAASPTGASGLGATNEQEIKMLASNVASLDPNSADFPASLQKIQRFLQKAQSTTVARGNLPASGEAFVMRHPQFGNVTEGIVNDLMRRNPGSTREQVLQFLKSTGGQ